jgi:hypothetical protein
VLTGAPSTTVLQGARYSFAPTVRNADEQTLTFSILNRPHWADFDAATGALSGTPAAADVGTYDDIRIRASDGETTASLAAFRITVTALAAGSVTLNWLPPTVNDDGTPLRDLGGYRVSWGTSAGHYPHSATIDNPGLSTYVVEHLTPATWFFTVTALSTAGVEGNSSDALSLTLQ